MTPPAARAHDVAGVPTTIDAALLATAAAHPDRDALVFPGDRRTWGQLAASASALARGLVGLGVRPGERIGVLMPNSPEMVASLLGILLAGGVVVPINTRYRAAELPYVVQDAELAVILTSDRIDGYVDLPGLLAEGLPGLDRAPADERLRLDVAPALRHVVVLGQRSVPGTVGSAALAAVAAEVAEPALEQRRTAPERDRTAIVLYTSGTTAKPRGCLLSHEALLGNWAAVASVLRVTAEDRVWAPCPLFHLAAIGPLTFCLLTGATFVSDLWFDPARALELVRDERASVLYSAYPPLTQGLLTAPGFDAGELPAARAMLNVAPPETLRAMQAALPQATQVSLYGLTEASGAVAYNELDDPLDVRVSTCGPPLPGWEVRIVDPATRDPLPAEARGEIAIRGRGLFHGYNGDPERTAALMRDGWFHTGDHGVLGEDGRLRYLGRLKEMLKVGGENVAPAEVEEHLATHPAVKLVQVVGIPDARLEEVVAAVVELRPGASATEEELIAHCRGQVASFKVPRVVRFTTEWPMSATKIQKGPLREWLLRELDAPQAREREEKTIDR